MAQAEVKTSDLLLEIKSKFNVGEMSHFEFKRYSREVENIKKVDACDGYHIEGVLLSIYDPLHPQNSLDCFEKALRLQPNEAVLWLNYSVALSIFSIFNESLEASKKALTIAVNTGVPDSLLADILEIATRSAVLSADFMEMKTVMQGFASRHSSALKNDELWRFFEEQGDAIDNELLQLGDVYRAVFSEHNVLPKGASQFVMPEGDCVIKLYIDTDNETVHRMNNAAIDKMVAGNIFTERFGVILAKDL